MTEEEYAKQRTDRGKEIRLQTIMIGASLTILGFFAVEVIAQGKAIAENKTFDVLIDKRVTRIDDRVIVLERK